MNLRFQIGGVEARIGVEHSGEVEGASDEDVRRAVAEVEA